jgi:L-amino acid N-acyltransferase
VKPARLPRLWGGSPVDTNERRAWLLDRQRTGYPVLVATDATDGVIGYASFGAWRAWDGHRFSVEHSVYARFDQRGKGMARNLMSELIERARSAGKHVMVAAIESRNEGSMRLHEGLGFTTAGHLKQVGTKFGIWLDLVFMQLILDERQHPD